MTGPGDSAGAASLWLVSRRSGVGVVVYARARLLTIIPGAALCVAAVLLIVPPPSGPPTRTTITMLDVGQGSATLVQVPDGPTVLIDAGPDPLAATLRDHGVSTIDLLVVSHGHDDHTGGLDDVIGAIPVGTAVLPRPPTPSATLDDLRTRLDAEGCRVSDCVTPFTVADRDLLVTVVPTIPTGEAGNQGENDCALVVVVSVGELSVLVPGDAEGEALAALSLPPVTVVEMPHHGSADGLDERLLGELLPRLALISVGADNRFGHPSAQTLDLLAAGAVPILRTDQVGDISLRAGESPGSGFEVSVERTP